jgi:hypothetical protein
LHRLHGTERLLVTMAMHQQLPLGGAKFRPEPPCAGLAG